MQMKNILFILFLLLSIDSEAGFFYKDLEFKAMENFEVERKDGKVTIQFDYVIYNPNWYSVVIMPSSMALKIADSDCGLVQIQEKIKIKKKEEGHYPFVLRGDASNFVKSTFSSIWALMSGKGVDFNLKGKLKAGIFVFRKKWEMDYTYKMSFDEFLSFF